MNHQNKLFKGENIQIKFDVKENEVINDAFFDWYYLKEHGDSNEWLKEFEGKKVRIIIEVIGEIKMKNEIDEWDLFLRTDAILDYLIAKRKKVE